jgi:phage gpG-like protein
MAKAPSFKQVQANIQGKLRINPKVMQASVPQLTFSPSVGIIARDIDKMEVDIRSFREPLKRAIKQVVIPSIQKNFEAEGRPAWEPYSEATYEIRERMGDAPPSKLLNKTGALQDVMKQIGIWTINQNAAILLDLPARVSYGKIHQGGYSKGSMSVQIKKSGSAAQAFRDLNSKIKKAIATGTTIQDFNFSIPARPFIMIQEEDVPEIQRVFAEWLGERIDRHWGKITR